MIFGCLDQRPGPTEPRLRAFMHRRWGPRGRGPLTRDEVRTPDRDLRAMRLTPEQGLVLGLRPTRAGFDRLLEFGCEDDDALVLLGLELGHLEGHEVEGMLADPVLLAARWLATRDPALLRALPWVPANDALAAAISRGEVTDPGGLRDLAAYGDPVVGSAIAQCPLADPSLLDALAHRHAADHRAAPYPDPLADVIANPDTSDATVAWLRAHGPRRTRAALIGRRDCPDLATYAVDPDYLIRVVARLNPSAPASLALGIASDPDPRARSLAVEAVATHDDLLSALASDADPGVRLLVAGKGATPRIALLLLATDPDPSVRARLAERSTPPPEILEQLSADPDTAVRALIAANRATPPDILARLAGDPNVSVQLAVGSNRRTPTEALFALAGSPDWEVWQAVAANPNSTPEALERVYRGSRGDPTWSVLVANPHTPRPVLEEISAHYTRTWTARADAALAGSTTPSRPSEGRPIDPEPAPPPEPSTPWLARTLAKEESTPEEASTYHFEPHVSHRHLGVHGNRAPSLDRHLWPSNGTPLPRRQALSPEARLDAILTPEQRRLLDGAHHYVIRIDNYPRSPRLRVWHQAVRAPAKASLLLEIDRATFHRFQDLGRDYVKAANDSELADVLKTWVRDIHQESSPGLSREVVQGRRALCDHPAWRKEHKEHIRSIIELETRSCPYCGATAVLVVDEDGYELYAQGASIRHAFPALTDDQHERIATGLHADCPRFYHGGFI